MAQPPKDTPPSMAFGSIVPPKTRSFPKYAPAFSPNANANNSPKQKRGHQKSSTETYISHSFVQQKDRSKDLKFYKMPLTLASSSIDSLVSMTGRVKELPCCEGEPRSCVLREFTENAITYTITYSVILLASDQFSHLPLPRSGPHSTPRPTHFRSVRAYCTFRLVLITH